MSFKVIVDTLASIASIVAITSVMVGWYRSARKPLKIRRVVVHKAQDSSTFILETTNRIDYQVHITRIDCYKRKIYEVMKKTGGSPEYAERLSSREAIFMGGHTFEVPAKAYTPLSIKISGKPYVPKKLIFSLDTSHGYHELICKNIIEVEVDKVEIFSADYKEEYDSKIVAKIVFYWRTLKELTSRW